VNVIFVRTSNESDRATICVARDDIPGQSPSA